MTQRMVDEGEPVEDGDYWCAPKSGLGDPWPVICQSEGGHMIVKWLDGFDNYTAEPMMRMREQGYRFQRVAPPRMEGTNAR